MNVSIVGLELTQLGTFCDWKKTLWCRRYLAFATDVGHGPVRGSEGRMRINVIEGNCVRSVVEALDEAPVTVVLSGSNRGSRLVHAARANSISRVVEKL
jgi:hypothetical protein